MPDGTRGPTKAQVEEIKRHLTESGVGYCEAQLVKVFTRLLKDTHTLGRFPHNSKDYRKWRKIVSRERDEYLAVRAKWVDAVVSQEHFGHRREMAQELTKILVEAVAYSNIDDPLAPTVRAIQRAIEWLEHS